MATPIVLWQMQPLWGLPNGSPFCMKVETWLRMAGLPYETRSLQGPPKSPTRKIPYIERPDGSVLCDSSTIIATLTREHDVALDRGLSAHDRAVGVLLQRTLEENLYFITLHERWVEDHNWPRTARDYFGDMPWAVRTLVVPFVRRKMIASAHGQGVARLHADERLDKAKLDLSAIAHLLGDKPYFFDQPTSYDAIAYAFLANLLWAPYSGPLRDSGRAEANLLAYCERMKSRYYADWKPV